ncbi:neprilysin-like 10 [Haematobia irritans]|uniref:neprilysin-like 10 n=1 Tax=Haematobia irritans TaxID=7368 RepID=UPI003F507136
MKCWARWSLVAFLYLTLLKFNQSDRVDLIRCEDSVECLANKDNQVIEMIKEHMYNGTNPCENFWDYACGSWTEAPYYDHVDTLEAMQNHYADQLIMLLEMLQTSSTEKSHKTMVQKVWRYFQACRTSGKYYLDMVKYLDELPMDQIFGEHFHIAQLYENSTESREDHQPMDWLSALAYLRSFGFNSIFFLESMGFASNDSWNYVVEIQIPMKKRIFSSKYKIREILEEFQFDKYFADSEDLWRIAEDVYAMDKQMVELYGHYEESRNNKRYLRLEELIARESALAWQKYFDLLIGKQVDGQQVILEISGKLDYFLKLSEELREKDTRLLTWYIILSFCKHLMDIRPLITDRQCLLHTNVMFPLAMNYLYDRFLYQHRKEDEEILENLLDQIKLQFSLYIQENKFKLTAKELEYLEDKLSAIKLQIGNLPSRLPHLNNFYEPLELSSTNFYANHLRLLKFRFLQQHKALWKSKRNRLHPHDYYVYDDISSLRTAPYFIHPRNLLLIPMAFLQLPFYNFQQNPLFHYSLIGWIMAHELSHAFDSYGLAFDANGHFNSLGYQISHKPRYLKTIECLSQSRPTLSLNERMADLNGMQLIWDLYSREFLKNSTSDVLSTEFSKEELFFLNFSQFFCGSLPPTTAHDMDDIRVRETLMNLREFLHIFQCDKNTEYTPTDTCDIWRK